MSATKVRTSLNSGTTMTAGAGDVTGTAQNVTAGYGVDLEIKLTNGVTGPTVAAQVQIQVSADNSGWYNYGGPLVGSVTNSAVVSWAVNLPATVQYFRIVSGSNTGQNVTLDAQYSNLTGV